MTRSVYVDVSEFASNPVRTGIQRVVRELVRNWPAGVPLQFIVLSKVRHRFELLPRAAMSYLVDLDRRGPISAEHVSEALQRLAPFEDREEMALGAGDRILVPELFYDPARIAAHRDLENSGAELYYIVFDLLTYTKPDFFFMPTPSALMPYLARLIEARHRCFISGAVRAEFGARVLRRPYPDSVGVAIPLGADSIQLPKRPFDARQRTFVCLGTFDGRKGQEVVREAFLKLAPGHNSQLTFIGRVPENVAPHLAPVLNNRSDDIRVVSDASDQALAGHLSSARASVYISADEGYGLPATESLNVGLPLIAHAGLPALSDIPPLGQIRLERTTAETVAAAMERLLLDDVAARLWREAADLQLQSWRTYGAAVADWVTG